MPTLIVSAHPRDAIPTIDEAAVLHQAVELLDQSAHHARLDFVQHCCQWANLTREQAEDLATLDWDAWLDRLKALKEQTPSTLHAA